MLNVSFSWDDGSISDLKLAEYFIKYHIPCKLFVPTYNRENRTVLSASQIQSLKHPLISFGGHTNSHVYLTQIPLSDINKEVDDNIKYLEDITGEPIKHFCLPGGQYNSQIIQLIKDQFDSIRTADTMCSLFTGKIRKPTFHFYPRGKRSLLGNAFRNKDRIFLSALKAALRCSNDFDMIKYILKLLHNQKDLYQIHIWGHSWEIEELQLWEELDEMLKYIKTSFPNAIKDYNNADFTPD